MLLPTKKPDHQPRTTSDTRFMSDFADLEPSEEWKGNLRKKIEEELSFMVRDARDDLEASSKRSPNDRDQLFAEYQNTMENIRRLAEEQFREGLGKERQERRWAAGMSLETNWMESLREEQEVIYQRIKKPDSKESALSSTSASQHTQLHSKAHLAPTGGSKETKSSPQVPERWIPQMHEDTASPPTHVGETQVTGGRLGKPKQAENSLAEGSRSTNNTTHEVAFSEVPELTKEWKTNVKSRIDEEIGLLIQLSTGWFEENASKVKDQDKPHLWSEVEDVKRSLDMLRSIVSDMFAGDAGGGRVKNREKELKGKGRAVTVDIAQSSSSGEYVEENAAATYDKVAGTRQDDSVEHRGDLQPESDAEQPAKPTNENEETKQSQLDRLSDELARKPKSRSQGLGIDAGRQSPKEPEHVANQDEERRRRRWLDQQEEMRKRAEEIERRAARGETKRQGNGTPDSTSSLTNPASSTLPYNNVSSHPRSEALAKPAPAHAYRPPPPELQNKYSVTWGRSATPGGPSSTSLVQPINHALPASMPVAQHNSMARWADPTISNKTRRATSAATTNLPPRPATAAAMAIDPTRKPRTASFSSSFPPPGATGFGRGSVPLSESEWTQRHAEFARQQQERFRLEQERFRLEQELIVRRQAERTARRRN